MRPGIVLAVAIVIPSVVLADPLPAQFGLACHSSGGIGSLARPTSFRIDMVTGSWCMNDCTISHGGAHLEGKDLILEVKTRDFDTGYKTTEIQTINADSLNYFGVSETGQNGQIITRQTILGTCELNPFLPVTGTLTPW